MNHRQKQCCQSLQMNLNSKPSHSCKERFNMQVMKLTFLFKSPTVHPMNKAAILWPRALYITNYIFLYIFRLGQGLHYTGLKQGPIWLKQVRKQFTPVYHYRVNKIGLLFLTKIQLSRGKMTIKRDKTFRVIETEEFQTKVNKPCFKRKMLNSVLNTATDSSLNS